MQQTWEKIFVASRALEGSQLTLYRIAIMRHEWLVIWQLSIAVVVSHKTYAKDLKLSDDKVTGNDEANNMVHQGGVNLRFHTYKIGVLNGSNPGLQSSPPWKHERIANHALCALWVMRIALPTFYFQRRMNSLSSRASYTVIYVLRASSFLEAHKSVGSAKKVHTYLKFSCHQALAFCEARIELDMLC